MKKILLGFVMVSLLLTGCGNGTRSVKTINEFNNVATENNFMVSNNIKSYEKDNYIKEASLADDGKTQIEMIVYNSVDSAISVQNNQIKSFNLLKNAGAGGEKKDKGKNYYKYFLVSNNYYMISTRVDNTLIFSKTPISEKDKVEKIINQLGY